MFIPIRTDRSLRRTPWVNYSLIATNVVVFLATMNDASKHSLAPYWLTPTLPRLSQFITYQFLHADLMHLLGNMLFLYVFGNSVEDRLGKFGYLCFYLSSGVVAGLGQALVEPNPILGASGAVAGVSGAFLVLFPMTNITIAYFFIFIGAFEVSGMVLILFQIAQDAFMFLGRYGGVAYLAHLSGYAFGIVIAAVFLWTKLLPHEPYDLLSMIRHRRRRAQFAAMTREGYQPWDRSQPTEPSQAAKLEPLSPLQQRVLEIRSQINQAIDAHNLDQAADLYTQLTGIDSGQAMNQQQQLDLANHLMSQRRYEQAASAYELFLNTYTGYAQREQIQLILGLVYGRYLNRRQRARELLSAALPRLSDPDQKQLAQQVLNETSN